MRKYTQREVKNFVLLGVAEDLTQASDEEIKSKIKHCEKVGYSSGIYGINGGIIQDIQSGQIYAITARNSALLTVF